MYIAKGSENTSDFFFRFLISFSEVLLTRSKSLWKAERTLCKLDHFGLFLGFFLVERLGLGKRDFFLKNRPALALYQV
jgi:hypothetical protein